MWVKKVGNKWNPVECCAQPKEITLLLSVHVSRSADNSLRALPSTPGSKSCACEHMASRLKSGVCPGYLACRSDP
jgi:hypothetical protein